MGPNNPPEFVQQERVAIESAMRAAGQDAIRLHQRLGLPLVEWAHGQIVLTPPETYQLPPKSD
jgi:hypothetical protein